MSPRENDHHFDGHGDDDGNQNDDQGRHDDPDPIPKLDNPMSVNFLKEHLNKTTPRMILNPFNKEHLLKKLETDEVLINMKSALNKNVQKILPLPIVERTLIGKRLLAVSNEVMYRMNVLCMHSCITATTNDCQQMDQILDRINREILAVCSFCDWNPPHFLDVAELCMALALAIDWVGHLLPESTVILVKKNLIVKGIAPSFDPHVTHWWIKSACNWNQVCHGGMIAAAVAIAEVDYDLAAKTLFRALDCMPYALHQYCPDGVYPEGSSYWSYGTTYSILSSSILETAFGTDFGIAKYPAFQESAMFRALSQCAPSTYLYNYSDCADCRSPDGDLTLAWFAAKTGMPLFYEKERFLRDYNKMGKLCGSAGAALVWLSQFEPCSTSCELPRAWKGDGCNPVVFMMDHHDDDDDENKVSYYFGAKGGMGSNNHGNMDAGSFVFELDGVRWVVDPGSQSYGPLEEAGIDLWNMHQDSGRWTLLTKNNFGHSTLTVNDELHRAFGMANITNFDDGTCPSAELDLTATLGGKLKSASRTFTKNSSSSLLIEDVFELSDETEWITWQLVTTSSVIVNDDENDGATILRHGDKALKLELLSIPKVPASIISLCPPPLYLDRQIKGLKRIDFRFPAYLFTNTRGTIRVRLSRP